MPDPDSATITTRLARGILAGLIAGAVASFAMDQFQALAAPLLPQAKQDSDPEPATVQAAEAVVRTVANSDIPGDQRPIAGQAVHYALGLVLGAAYGAVAEFRPKIATFHGLPFGIGTATLLDEAAVPAMGLGVPPWQSDAATHLYSYASHLVFGGVTELVRRRIAATLHP